MFVGRSDEYEIADAKLFRPVLNESNAGADKFLSSRELWNRNGRTIILYGDVYFTEEAIVAIFEYPHADWRLFGRAFESTFTGSDHGECFGISFYHESIAVADGKSASQ
jgi:hypothetical protein